MSVSDVRARYDADSVSYPKYWAPVLREAMQPLLQRLSWAEVRLTVEVGCGTGGVLRDIASLAPAARVMGVDLSAGMLSQNRHTGTLLQADVQALPLFDASADAIVCGFTFQHVPQPEIAVAEFARVSHAGGQLALAAWVGSPRPWLATQIVDDELDRAGVPPVQGTPAGGTSTDSATKLETLLSSAGFRIEWLEVRPLRWQPTVDAVVAQLTTMRSTGRRFALLDAATAPKVRAAIRRRLAQLQGEAPPPHDVCLVRAQRSRV